MNKCIFIGNLTRDPELNVTSNGVNVTRFGIAVNRKFKKEDGNYEVDFFNCVAWRGTGDVISKYFHKGDKIAVVGEMQTGSYEDKDGVKRNTIELVVSEFDFIGKTTGKINDDDTLVPVDDDEIDNELPF